MELQLGPLFAILTAASFALSQVLIRRSTYQSEESFTPLAVSLLVGTPIFILLVTFSGEWKDLLSFSWQQYTLLAAAGLVHLIIARYLFFNSTRIIGANPTVAITRASVIFSVILGVVLLGESVTALQIFAALLIMVGAILTTTEISRKTFRISTRGLLMGLGVALCSAGSATLIRPVMTETDAIYAATFVMYLAAFVIIMFILLFRGQQRNNVMQQGGRMFLILSSASVFLVVGHLFRFSALQYSPVSVVQPLIATIVVFTLLFSWIVNRRIDIFNWRVVAGVIMVLAGVFLIYG
ncbi:MAG: DMT family transporter [Dehalococcoidales bacterium]|nr:DMT family transporter [Dehalococcoidales bacterium]